MMSNATRIKIAAVTTALVLGGLTAAGFALRGGEDAPSEASTTASKTALRKPVVVHRRKVKTIVAEPRAGNATVAASAPAPAPTAAATVTAPASLGALPPEDGEHAATADTEDEWEPEDESDD